MPTETPNRHYNLPAPGTPNWDQPVNENFTAIDLDMTAVMATADAAEVAVHKGAPNGYAALDGAQLVPLANIPPIPESRVIGLVADLAASSLASNKPYIDAGDAASVVTAENFAKNIANITTGVLALSHGGTHADLSGTGGAHFVLQQSSMGADITVGQLSSADLSNGSTGTGLLVLQTSPTLITPNIDTATATAIIGLTAPTTPNVAGGTTIGSASLPFSSIYIGGAATNNTQITGTVTGARVLTLPDANSNTVQPSTAPTHEFATAISASGVITWTQPNFTDLLGSIALSQTVLTTLGDIEYVNSVPALARLAGNTTATKKYLSQTGNGSISAPPVWAQIAVADLSDGTTGSGSIVLATSPTLVTPTLGVASATSIIHLTAAVTPNAAGGTDIGSTLLPFANVYVGGAGTNNNKITSATTTGARTFTLPDANSNPVQPATAPANQFATAISAAGVITWTQPSFSNLSGSITLSQTALTTAGDFGYVGAGPALTRLAGNSTGTKQFLSMTSSVPSWGVLGTADFPSGAILASPVINGTPSGTGIPTTTLKKGSGNGTDYTSTSTAYVDVDATNLAYTVTIPTGWKLLVWAYGSGYLTTATVTANVALFDSGTLIATEIESTIGTVDSFYLHYVIAGDGGSHTVKLQYKTSSGSDAVNLVNSSTTVLPSMLFLLTPSN